MIHTRALVRENKKKIIESIDLWMESSSIRIRFQFDWERKARVSRAIRSHVRSFHPCLYPNTGTRTTRVHETIHAREAAIRLLNRTRADSVTDNGDNSLPGTAGIRPRNLEDK